MTTLKPTDDDWPVGAESIPRLASVPPGTANSWRARGKLPEPDYGLIGARQVWSRGQIIVWLLLLGRMRCHSCGQPIRHRHAAIDRGDYLIHAHCPTKETP